MVFMLAFGAVKAAQQARCQYVKDKKRNEIITPVEGSQSMMADRGDPNAGASEWWGSACPADAPSDTADPSVNHGGVGAWSRDRVNEQTNVEDRADIQSSASASSPSASMELSGNLNRLSRRPSSTASTSDVARPASQTSAEMTPPATISNDEQERDACPGERDDSSLEKCTSLPANGAAKSSRSPQEESTPMKDSSTGDDARAATTMKHRSGVEGTAIGQPQQTKKFVQGSFEEALGRKLSPRVREETMANTRAGRRGETVSALSRNASKGLRKRPSRMEENVGQGSQGPVTVPDPGGKPEGEVVSALARNASKGPRRRPERPVKASGSGEGRGVVNRRVGGVAGEAVDAQKGVSAFAGAVTKKRVGRRPPTTAQFGDVTGTPRPATGVVTSTESLAGTTNVPTAVAGSSMYAQGSMKKRTSRR